MTRLIVLVEGETEETFINEVLRRHLVVRGYKKVSARLMGNSRQRDRRGGIRPWNSAKRDILNLLNGDSGCIVTTMVDYYGLPQSGNNGWPGRANAQALSFDQKARTVEEKLLNDVVQTMGTSFNSQRFIPFIVMHEFEGLLFSDCELFARGVSQEGLIEAFQKIRNEFPTPEEINDSPQTAPSKRVKDLMPDYQKPFHGNLAMLEIGLDKIRVACPHFCEWLARLEKITAK